MPLIFKFKGLLKVKIFYSSMPTDSDEEDWYDRRRRLDAEEGISRIGIEGGGGTTSPPPPAEHGPQLRKPLMMARNQAFAMAGLLSDYDDGYEETYRFI